MRRRDSRRNKNKLFKLFRLGLSLFKAVIREIGKFFRFAVKELLFEISLGIITLGLAYVFASWGMSQNLALYIAVVLALGLSIVVALVIVIDNGYKSKSSMRRKVKGEVKLAVWIAQIFSNQTSSEWTEYQDWLHDILLARRQLLDTKCPRWKVAILTYWRLSILWVVVSMTKMKSIAVSIMKLR
ncbi:hypothetical protein [Pleurocapsa sp. PCC 7319]|uniref:hypothetical protein n=1 Tax=Pleurocapsa sp. PCC 7319 TaxID=118161 RepID=UPI00034D8032|nr:hypothetical protein [Pleurocapsa sp. PCC 7319]